MESAEEEQTNDEEDHYARRDSVIDLLDLDVVQRHYSVEELAGAWNLSDDFVRKLFLNEPGVVVFSTSPRLE